MSSTHKKLHTYRTLLTLAGLSVLTVCSDSAIAAEDSPSVHNIIESRQAGLKKMGAAMKAIVGQLKSGAPDSAKMAAAAQAISAGAQQQHNWFPAGSGPESGLETDALPYIWQNRAKFDSIISQLMTESKNLTTVISGNDPAAIGAQVKTVGNVCGDCHHSFRAD
jgi:cytochrome c556